MKINDFELECYFGKFKAPAPYLLTQSDCESLTTRELLALEPEAEQGYLEQWLGYTNTQGDSNLRASVASLYQNMSAEDVLIINGAQEGIFGYMNVMLDEGDHMITMFPNYQPAYEVANSIPGCTFSKWRVRDDGEKWVMDFSELEALIRPETKLIAVSSPNNPTGYTFTNAEIEKLCDICRRYDLYLFADEVFKGLEHDGERRDWIADHYEKAVSLGVMSKAYGLAGLRVGWLVSKNHEILDRVMRFKHYMSICDAAPSEYLSKLALRHGEKLLERSRAIINGNMKLINAFFDRHKDLFEKKPPCAGPVAFHKLLIDMPAEDFCRLAVDKKGVLLLPAEIFGMNEPYFRMGYGGKGVPESLAKFEEFLVEEGFA